MLCLGWRHLGFELPRLVRVFLTKRLCFSGICNDWKFTILFYYFFSQMDMQSRKSICSLDTSGYSLELETFCAENYGSRKSLSWNASIILCYHYYLHTANHKQLLKSSASWIT